MVENDSNLTIDEKRKRQAAYEYLCHLEEAKLWISYIIKEDLPNSTDLELFLRSGVVLAKIAHFCDPVKSPKKKIFDIDHRRYDGKGLHFKHTDNLDLFLKRMDAIGFPKIFYPETTDLYDMKNLPKVIYCIHALSYFLFKLGKAPLIQNLYGKVEFSEEDIKKVQTALEKYGIQMPAFSKIGGILAGELSENEAALHAAILLINEAVDSGDNALLLERMQNMNAQLLRVHPDYIDRYMNGLSTAKKAKLANCQTKGSEDSGDEDVYDKILTQAEIQGHLNVVNLAYLLERITKALSEGDKSKIETFLFDDDLGSNKVLVDHKSIYYSYLKELYSKKSSENSAYVLTLEDVENCLCKCNDVCFHKKAVDDYIKNLSSSLLSKNIDSFSSALMKIPSGFPTPDYNRKKLNYDTFQSEFTNNKNKFDEDSIIRCLKITELLANINKCLENKSDANLSGYLQDPVLGLSSVDSLLSNRYLDNMIRKKEKKCTTASQSVDLLLEDVAECVNYVNTEHKAENDLLSQIAKINEVLKNCSADELFLLLSSKEAKLKNVVSENKHVYREAIIEAKVAKELKTGDPHECLWHNEIQDIINKYNDYCEKARSVVVVVEDINKSSLDPRKQDLVFQLLNRDFIGIVDECKGVYFNSIKEGLSTRNVDGWNGWSEHSISSPMKVKFYYNHKSNDLVFTKTPSDFVPNVGYFNHDEIQELCNKVTSGYNREKYFKSNESVIKALQSWYRTKVFLAEFLAHLDFKKNKLPHLLVIQAFARSLFHKRWYTQRVEFLKSYPQDSLCLKLFVKASLKRLELVQKLKYYAKHLQNIIALQSLIRASQTLNDYNNLMHQDNPSCKAVCKFVRLLEFDANDLQEERCVATLTKNIYEKIRDVQQQEQEIKDLYIKIGLFVKSRYNLQELISHSKQSSKKAQKVVYGSTISKEKLELREKYGHIFYILQAYPIYPSRLILAVAPNRSNKYTRDTCFALYSFSATVREEFSIIKMLQTAINIEVETKIDSIEEIYRGDPIVVTIAVYLFRDLKSHSYLNQILHGPVMSVITNKNQLSLNPVDVYKVWISQMETETGQASGMPYDVDSDKAYEYEEVRNRIKIAQENLKHLCDKFVDQIVASSNLLPYGIRFIAKVLAEALHRKFPDALPNEIFKAVGNILYYRLLNPPIVSPDGYKFFDVEKNEISSEQRRNLAAVAAILQKAAASSKFDDDSSTKNDMNDYLESIALKFRGFYKACIDVEEPEEHFGINEFTDQVTIQKPDLRLSCNQIIDIHKLIVEYMDVLCPSENDILLKAVRKINGIPHPSDLVDQSSTQTGATPEEIDDALGDVVISLDIIPIVELEDTEESRMKALFEETTKMVIDLMHFETADSLSDILSKTYTAHQESSFQQLQAKRMQYTQDIQEKTDMSDSKTQTTLQDSSLAETILLTLEETKQKVIENSKILEKAGLISESDGHKAIIKAVARRLINFRDYRARRNQNTVRLREISNNLDTKIDYCARQKEFYCIYLNSCVENFTRRKKTKGGSKNRVVVKKTAAKLHSLGVILEIEGLVTSQFKNVIFEISSTDDPGVFNVSAKLFGVQMESVIIVFQDLLQQQYNNVTVMLVLDRVKVNLNLLIHLLNEKFYSKKK